MITDWMDRFVAFGNQWLMLTYLATWRALPIFLIAAGLCVVLRRRLSPAVHALLWSIVVCRLLLPLSLGSPTSLHGQIDSLTNTLLGTPSLGIVAIPKVFHLEPGADAETTMIVTLTPRILVR